MMIERGLTDPLSILLVTSGTRGDRLLFKYPTEAQTPGEQAGAKITTQRNPYAVKITEDHYSCKTINAITEDGDPFDSIRFSDQILANLLAVKSDLCSQKFNIKVDSVQFIGYPMVFDRCTSKQTSTGKTSHQIISFNVVLALKSTVCLSVVNCYHDLMKQLTVAIHYEERRRQYLSHEAKKMLSVHDEVATLPEDSMESPFRIILERSSLAQELKTVYDSLCDSGVVQLLVNDWISVSFCLPQRVHQLPCDITIEPEAIKKCLESLRPYHGILLLVEKQALLDFLQIDSTQALNRLINVLSPLKSLQNLALDADLCLSQVFLLVSHLVYWAKVTVIYPMCETNVYVLSPMANTLVSSSLEGSFVSLFPDRSLPMELAEFSFPVLLRDTCDIMDHPKQQEQKVYMVQWMLQHRLIIQLHTYVFFVPPLTRRKKKVSEDISRINPAMPMLPEEESLGSTITGMQRASSVSDVASVNSDESISMGMTSISANQFSKSPSSEIASDSSQLSEEIRSKQHVTDGLAVLSKEEKDCVMNVPASQNPDDLHLFSRLCLYFNGKHHVEEIMYYENLNRSQLITLLDKFREVLIMTQFQDPATSLGVV